MTEQRAAKEVTQLIKALSDLVTRCDGEEGMRADGSNIDTCAAHAVLEQLTYRPETQTATRGQLINRGIKAAGGYPAPKGFRVVGYGFTRGTKKGINVTAHVSRTYAHHMTGKVYERVIARGANFEEALEAAIKRVCQIRGGRVL